MSPLKRTLSISQGFESLAGEWVGARVSFTTALG
jgi:hypothetical protein